jgi:ABC-type branched-subunit amino acid transport system substrate-binding protein/outer membrane protein assembly factor BamD (BamD/ComL family)
LRAVISGSEGDMAHFGRLLFLILISIQATAFPAYGQEGASGRADPFERGEHHFKYGEWKEAEKYFHDVIASSTHDDKRDRAHLRLGQIELKREGYRNAFRYFDYVFGHSNQQALVYQARFYIAECYFKLGDTTRALELFREIQKSDSDAHNRWEATLYLALIDARRGDYENAVGKLESVLSKSRIADLESRVREEAEKIAAGMDKPALVALIDKYSRSFPGDVFLLRLLNLYRLDGDGAKYRSALQSFVQNFPNHPRVDEYERALGDVKEGRADALRVAVVLPLTGKNAIAGNRVLQGIQLAWRKLNPEERERFELVVKDSGGAKSAVDWIEQVALDARTAGILGPMFSKEIEDSLSLISEYRVSAFTPTASNAGLMGRSSYLFRNVLTRENQGRFLARYAVNHLGLKRIAILYSNESYGEELRDAFRKEVEGLGGQIVAVVPYERTGYDFKDAILQLGGVPDGELKKMSRDKIVPRRPLEAGENGVPLSRPVLTNIPGNGEHGDNIKAILTLSYDAVFIPGLHDKVGLIIPQLIYYNIDTVTLLGPNGWNSPELARSAGRFMRNAVFVDGFFGKSQEAQVQDFVGGFKAVFSEEPTILSGQSYDAASMMIQALRSGVKNRVQMQSYLSTVKDFPGVSGVTTFMANGDADKKMFILKVQGGEIVEAE